jgi:hypothetical protein
MFSLPSLQVLSEALDVMNAQLLELEEQVSQKQPSPLKKNNSKTSSSSSGTTSATGHKKREDAHQLTPRSPHEISSRETTPHSPYDSTSTLSPSDVAVTISSPVLQQLFVSLTQEIHNWKLLASSRLMQSMKLSPLPTPRKHSCHPQLLSPGNGSQDQGSEERKESEVKGVTDVKNIRQEVHQLKRYPPPPLPPPLLSHLVTEISALPALLFGFLSSLERMKRSAVGLTITRNGMAVITNSRN